MFLQYLYFIAIAYDVKRESGLSIEILQVHSQQTSGVAKQGAIGCNRPLPLTSAVTVCATIERYYRHLYTGWQRCCKYLTLKYKYKYKYSGHKYKYKYKYLKLTIKYNPSTGTHYS